MVEARSVTSDLRSRLALRRQHRASHSLSQLSGLAMDDLVEIGLTPAPWVGGGSAAKAFLMDGYCVPKIANQRAVAVSVPPNSGRLSRSGRP